MRRLMKAVAGSVCAAAVICGMSACSNQGKDTEPVVSVQVATARLGSIEQIISSDAVLFPIQQASIIPKITAPVKRFYVNRGSVVEKGQLLAKLEDRDLEASAVESQGSLAQAQAAYASTITAGVPEEMQKAELDVQGTKQVLDAEEKLYDSRENLYKQGALPRKDLDQARVSLTQARNQYDIAEKHLAAMQATGKEQALKAAEGQLQAAKGKYANGQAQLSYAEIRSPMDGVIAERPLYPGETATSGVPLFVVMNIAQIIAKAHVPAQDAALLKIGDPALITSSATKEPIPARITVVSPATDPNSTTVEIWSVANNSKNLLRPGTTAQLSIVAQSLENALLVPSTALLSQPDGNPAVMIAGPDNRVHLQVVEIGIQSKGQTQITSGVKAGQRIVVNGGYGLPDNTKILIETAGATKQKAASD